MFEGNYSKKVWIITIVMALGSIAMDIFFMTQESGLMQQTVWFTLPIAGFILFKAVEGLIKKIKEEKEEQE